MPNKVSIGCDISCGTQAAANAVKAICAHLGSGSKSDYIAYSVECRLTQVAGDLAFAKRIRGAKSKLCLYFKDGQELSRQAPEQTVIKAGVVGYVKPIIFLLGLSGIGKSFLSEMLEKNKFLYVHIDTDSKKRTFEAKGFPSIWDDDFHKVNFAHLVGELRDRLGNEHAGAVVSLPTVYVFPAEKLVEAAQLGVTPVVMWGKQEDCIRAAKKRIENKGGKFNLPRYEKKNAPTFRAYGLPEYAAFRVEAFQEDGSRYPNEKWLTRIMERTGG